ncbi:hypothetical protein FB385_1519 [Paramicrobacterium agarici]|uniref:Uncharacterized protein n=1 Tax=Paramicrobacterium agarici TaxID=630514 RepID=A0A2A9DTG5_9MICO|nr:hypothetical protein ATJ78_0573 [Microbacterium agarici]TQO22684.1 hypothetical protein FB385_1519 [Microbacterium agarici]
MLTHEQHLVVDHVRMTRAHSHATSTLAVMLLQQRPRWAGELRDGLCTAVLSCRARSASPITWS